MKILHVDMDGVIANFHAGIEKLDPNLFIGDGDDYNERSLLVNQLCEKNPHIFFDLPPIIEGVESVHRLMEHFDVHFLSTPMDTLPQSFTDKKIWLDQHFGHKAAKKLTLTHHKNHVYGDFLVDDTLRNGVLGFKGEHIHIFTDPKFMSWKQVEDYLIEKK